MATPTTGLAAAACPAYPWPQDGAQRGQKVFMQSDCAACHSMLPYASLREAAAARGEEARAKAAEIIVVTEEVRPALATGSPIHGGAYSPALATLVTEEGLLYNLYSTAGVIVKTPVPRVIADGTVCQVLKKKMVMPSPVWLQFVQSYTRIFQAA